MATERLTCWPKVVQEMCGRAGNKIHSIWLCVLVHGSPTSFVCLAAGDGFQFLVSLMWTCTWCGLPCYHQCCAEAEKLQHKLYFFPRMVHSLARAFVVCTSLNCYRNILLSLIISLQFGLHFLSVLSRALWFSNSSSLVFQMFLLHAEFTTAVLLLFPPSPFILIYLYILFFSVTQPRSQVIVPSIVVFNPSFLYYKEKLGLWKWSSSAVKLKFSTSKMKL